MRKEISKGSKEFEMFNDFWNLCKKYWIAEKERKYFDAIFKDVDELLKKYKGLTEAEILFAMYLEYKNEEFEAISHGKTMKDYWKEQREKDAPGIWRLIPLSFFS